MLRPPCFLPMLLEGLESRTLLSTATGWTPRGPGGGGAFFASSFSPHHADELYVASDMSGLYHTNNLGQSWSVIDFKEIQANRQAQVQFTNDQNVLYALDYSTLAGGVDAVRPSKSIDGGVHWTSFQLPDPSEDARFLYADPNSTQNLIVTDYHNLYFSTDGGATLTEKYTAGGANGLYIGGVFFDGASIYVGTNIGLLVSTDGGSHFTASGVTGIPNTQAIFSFAGAKQGTTTRLYAVTLPTGDVYPGTTIEDSALHYQSIYSMDVGLTSWLPKTSGIVSSDRPSFISAARNNINIVYVAGASTGGAPSVYKSTNGAGTWTRTLTTSGNANAITGWQGASGDSGWGFGELAMSFEVSPADPNRAAFTDYGYVHTTMDGGATWRQAYVNRADENPAGASTPQHKAYHSVGLEDTSALWLNWSDATHLFAGYTDITGVRSADGGQSWSFPTYNPRQNTIYNIAASNSGNTLYAATSSIHDIYQSTHLTDASIDGGSGQVLFSTDSGVTWNTLYNFGHPVVWVATDPTDPNRAYASVVNSSVGGIYTTTNLSAGAAATWTIVGSDPRMQGHPFDIRVLNDGSLVVTYSARRTASFTNSSGVFFSSDHGANWSDLTDKVGTGMRYYTKDLTIDPTDPSQNTWWAAVRSGWGGNGNDQGGLYKTTDRGANWARVFGPNNDGTATSVESVTINPTTREMYIATLDQGLWYAPDVTAPTLNAVQTSYPFRQPERIFFNPFNTNEVWIASFGYGLTVGTTSSPPTVNAATFDYLKNPNEVRLTFSANLSATLNASAVTVTNLTTSVAFPATVNYPAGNLATLTFAGAPGGVLPDGNYRLTLNSALITDPTTGLSLDGNSDGTPGGNYTFDFFALGGDANHDRKVDLQDLYILATHYQQTAQTFNTADFNHDGTVNAADLGILSAHWQQQLLDPPPPSVAASLLQRSLPARRVINYVI